MSIDNITNMQNMTAYINANQKNINTLFKIVNEFLPEYANIRPVKPFVDNNIPTATVVFPNNSKLQPTATIVYPPDKVSSINDKIDDNNPITKFLDENPNIDPLSDVYPTQQLKTERPKTNPNTTRKSKGNGKSKRNKNSGKRKYTRKKGKKKSIGKRRPPWRG